MRRLLRVGLACGIVAVAAGFAADGRWPWRRLEPTVAPRDEARPLAVQVRDTLRAGETLGALLARHGITGLDLRQVLPGLDPRRLRAGLPVQLVKAHPRAAAQELRLRADDRRFVVRQVNGGWTSDVHQIRWTAEPIRVAGTIRTTLFDALDEAAGAEALDRNARAQVAYAMADVFAWQLDFSSDIQPGDRFTVVLDRETSDEGDVRLGRVVAGELLNDGRRLSAYAFKGSDNRPGYFDAEGVSLRRAFLAAPVEFRRISSGFSRGRFHPVLGRFRAHEGIDYAAAPGTPVMAAGDGQVARAGWSGGYGNLVELRHRNGVVTRYGHLKRIARGLRSGARVTQGEIIGYVGSTGLSTGPHLHYEFRVNGIARDYQTVDKGQGAPMPAADRTAFQEERRWLDGLLHPDLAPPQTASR